jgi:hypothetical protein
MATEFPDPQLYALMCEKLNERDEQRWLAEELAERRAADAVSGPSDDDPFNAADVSPEQALRNVARCLLEYTEVTRQHNGRGRMPTYAADAAAIRDAARQLAEMVLAQVGEASSAYIDCSACGKEFTPGDREYKREYCDDCLRGIDEAEQRQLERIEREKDRYFGSIS